MSKTVISQIRTNGHWLNTDKEYRKYDSKERELEAKNYYWEEAWIIKSENINSFSDTLKVQSSYSYTDGIKKGVIQNVLFFENDTLVERQVHKGLGEGFTRDKMYWYRYENGDLIQTVNYNYDHALQKYVFFYLYDDYFNGDHSVSQKNEYAWDGSEWSQRVKEDFYYTGSLLTKAIKQLKWSNTDFIPNRKREYSDHDNQKRPLTTDTYDWNSSTELWELRGVDSVKYDRWGNTIEHASMEWNPQYNRISGGYKDIEEYNEIGDLIKSNRYKWNIYTKSWYLDYGSIKEDYGDSLVFNLYLGGDNYGKSAYIYENGNRVRHRGYVRNGLDWTNNTLTIYYYSGITDASDIKHPHLSLFPNPTSGKVFIKGSPSTIKVFNSSGSLLFEDENVTNFDISGYAPGMYYIKLGDTVEKLIKK